MNRNRAQRLAQQRQANAPVKPDAKAQVAQINEIIQSAKGIWFGLLTYLAFVGVTLMSVRDADFFLQDRDTLLPLIGVSVPTRLFFAVSPIIGALIYAYFHMQLLKLWEALASVDPKNDGTYVSDHIKPWLVADMCLSYRNDNALRPRPLARISNKLNFLIVFWGTPLVLFAIWLLSAVPHIDWLTLLACGLPLTFTLFVGMNSWYRLQLLAKSVENDQTTLPPSLIVLFALAALFILTWGWLRVEGTLKNYAIDIGSFGSKVFSTTGETGETGPPPKDPNKKAKNGFLDWEITAFLPSAILVNVNFSQVSDNWLSIGWFRAEHRTTWCRSFDLPGSVCAVALDLNRPGGNISPNLGRIRTKWCQEFFGDDASDNECDNLFLEYKKLFETDWRNQRTLELIAVQSFNFSNADLRGSLLAGAQLQMANLSNALLQKANLEGAKLERAYLENAQLQGAYLKDAQLQDANLIKTQLQKANLEGAKLERAYLEDAQLQGAYLKDAQLSNATLIEAQLQNAFLHFVDFSGARLKGAQLQHAALGDALFHNSDLEGTQLQGALLQRTRFSSNTKFGNTNFRGAAFKEVDLAGLDLTLDQIKGAFGDASVNLPGNITPTHKGWPGHWSKEKLQFKKFVSEWQEFQATLPEGWDKTASKDEP